MTALGAVLVTFAIAPSPARALTPVTVTIVASPDSVFVNDTITITATVVPNPGACPILLAGANLILDPANGTATTTYVRHSATTGMQFDGVFMGCDDYASSTWIYSNWVEVKQRPMAISLTSPTSVGRADEFSVSVGLSPASPSGTVRIREVGPTGIDGILGRVIGQKTVAGSSPLRIDLPGLYPGSYQLQAEFSDSDEYAAATSTKKNLTVTDRPTTTTITDTPDASKWGQPVNVQVVVDPPPGLGYSVLLKLDGTWVGWLPLNPNGVASTTIDPGDPGQHTISAEFGSQANPTPPEHWGPSTDSEPHTVSSTPLDTTAPTGTVTINDGAGTATSLPVGLTMTVSDASPIRWTDISNDGVTWYSAQGNQSGIGWTFDPAYGGVAGDGTKTVYVRWRDWYGNTSLVATDTIFLDYFGPTGTVTIFDGSGGYVTTTAVNVSVPATDGGSSVSQVSLSNDGTTWTTKAYAPTIAWNLTSGDGQKTVHVKWRDANGHWSDESTDTVTLDTTAPSATAPNTAFASGAAVSSGATPTKFTWSGADAASGIDHYEAALSTDGGAYTTVSTSLASATVTQKLAAGRSYRLRVRAVDKAGHVGTWMYGSTFTVAAFQETSTRITYGGTWTRPESSAYWGRHVKYAKANGARATFTFTGRGLAWVGCVGPARGSATVYVDGVAAKTVNLHASSGTCKKVVLSLTWSTSASRQIRIVVSGSAGHPRVDLDALVTAT